MNHWALLLQHLPAPVYLCDVNGYIVDCNQAAIELWGRTPELSRERWQGAHRLYQADGEDLPLDRSPTAFALRSGKPIHDAELIMERPDGSRRIVRVNPRPIFDESGKLLGAVDLMLDATAFKEADHARARLAAIVESSEDAIVSKNLDGIIQTWNRGAERLFGYSAAEAIGHPITILIPEDRLEEEPRVLARIRNGQLVEHFETIRRRKDGSPIHIGLTISPIRDRTGTIVGASKIARDIGDRVRSEQALREADRRKDEFIATMAHELRNPLAPLAASLQLIEMGGYDKPVSRSTCERMQRQVRHLTRLVEDLLDLSRLTHGKVELRRESLAVGDVVNDAVEIAGPRIEAKGHRLELLVRPGLRVHGDGTRLVQVLANLLNNACKFTPASGHIRVVDNGIGIAAEHQDSVFEMFGRVRGGAGAEGGMGIGLSLARYLVELHGGTIRLFSEGPGAGTEVMVMLPLEPGSREAAAPGHPGSIKPDPGLHRILIVDDNEDAAASLQMLFRTVGHEVAVVHCGHDALTRGAEFLPDTLLLDIGLPDISGNDVAVRIRLTDWGKAALLIAVTGWGDAKDRQRTTAAGFDHHLVKPVDFDVLERLIIGPAATRH